MNKFTLVAAPLVPSDQFEDSTGIKSKTFNKQLIKVGNFKGSDFELDVTPDRIKKWIKSFERMKSNGVSVPIVSSHDAMDDPDDFLGYVQDMFFDGEWLNAKVTIRGSDSIMNAQRVDQVSIELIEDYRDGMDNLYEQAIVRVALTPNPLIPGQSGFEKIAASLRILNFSDKNKGETGMNKDFILRMQNLLDNEDITKDNVGDVLEDHITKLSNSSNSDNYKSKYEMAQKKLDDVEALSLPKINSETLEDRASLYGERIDRLAEDGKVPEAICEKIKDVLLGEPTTRSALCLSTNGGRDKPLAKQMISLLEQIPAKIEFGQKSLGQVGVLDDAGRDGIISLTNNKANSYMRNRIGLGG